ncbi:Pyridoxamine 5-phosphate oxidase family protein [Haladaptatus paucihalophilus DX253]|uniref:Pyridoxamine 5'-phosphate oxidase n=1 Tax=Haladaptatus paucihalophilus DX253 TaxID=797209 RepID=E7QQX1_HALPU|nr:pyridoxamine 5'-phosphate oxidase family protein [Haladaptatus paucihalophilus]EFW93385.1 Pyridoxamine 5-phosphate oxidase family protein [Haladaptatus paucihalophilus DX253]SHK53240.1 Pyridoxamine 5'-phosphate oxidase [Haladaptatus paucihalophilus DX253]
MADVLPDDAEACLAEESVMAHLATCSDDRPHVAPVWYHYDDGTVSILTGGRKLANIRENPRVAVSVQQDTAGRAEWKVTMQGTAMVVEDEEETLKAAERINPRYGADADAYPENTLVKIEVGSGTFTRY